MPIDGKNKPGCTPWFPDLTERAEQLWLAGESIASIAAILSIPETTVIGHMDRERRKRSRFPLRNPQAERKLWTTEENQRLKSLVEQGLPNAEIAIALGRTKASCASQIDVLRQSGAEIRFRHVPFDAARVDSVITLFESGKTRREVAELIGIDEATLKDHMARQGIFASDYIHQRTADRHRQTMRTLAASFPGIYEAAEKLTKFAGTAFIDGMILGDSHVSSADTRSNSAIDTVHSSEQAEYALLKYFALWLSGFPCRISPKLQGDASRETAPAPAQVTTAALKFWDIRVATLDLEAATTFRARWYRDGVKIIPDDFKIEHLEVIAVWYADDGYLQYKGPGFATHSFTASENERLATEINRHFANLVRVHSRHEGYGHSFLLYAGDATEFYRRISPILEPIQCIHKKLLGPTGKRVSSFERSAHVLRAIGQILGDD